MPKSKPKEKAPAIVGKARPEIPDFGITNWPPNTPLLQRHQACAYHNKGNGSFWHRKALCQSFWPEETFAWHDWSDRMLKSTCDYNVATWIGAGGTGKTTEAAAIGIQWWLEAPFESALMACSTTIKMLKLRIWSEFSRLFLAMPKSIQFQNEQGDIIETTKVGYIGELVDSDLMIRWRQGDNKHAIFGFGVNEGSVAEAVANLVGIHARRIWLMLDELQGIREAIDNAKDNMSKNALFRVLGMGNTDENMKSLLRRAAKPINGWDSVDTTTADSWETDGGVVAEKGIALRFDGRKSPGVINPKKYPFLIGQKHIDAHLRKVGGNEQDPSFLSQCCAVWPSIGLQNTVLDHTIVEKFHCQDKANWTDGFQIAAALDPAFSFGGDRRLLQLFKFGLVNDNDGERWVIEFGEWMNVPVDSSSGEPIDYQVVNYCKDACKNQGVTNDEFASDSSGSGKTLTSIFAVEWGVITGIEFGGSPSDTPYDEKRTAKDVYDRRVSELHGNLRNFALGNGIRGLSKEAMEQACSRRMIFKNKKNSVEKKDEMKLRTGESPDNLDACCIAVAYAMMNGARPGGSVAATSRKVQSIMAEMAEEGRRMSDESNYLLANY